MSLEELEIRELEKNGGFLTTITTLDSNPIEINRKKIKNRYYVSKKDYDELSESGLSHSDKIYQICAQQKYEIQERAKKILDSLDNK